MGAPAYLTRAPDRRPDWRRRAKAANVMRAPAGHDGVSPPLPPERSLTDYENTREVPHEL